MAYLYIAAAGLAAAGAVVGGILNANAAAGAAQKQKQAADQAMGLERETLERQERLYQQQRQDMMPWMEAGRGSLADLVKMTQSGYDPSQLANDPGYQFRMAEGQKALERSASARGTLNSGGFAKGLTRYSQGVASDEFQNRYNRLSNIAGLGQTAAQNIGAYGSQLGANMGQSSGRMGDLYGARSGAEAAGIIGQGNAYAGMAQGIGNALGSAVGGMGGAGGGFGGMTRLPTQNGYQGGMMPGRGANFGLNYGGGY
jgi:hypothetical protein